MAQDSGKILPLYINTDKSYDSLGPDESPLIKGFSWDINGNPGSSIGTNNPSGEGQNLEILTPTRSNARISNVVLPSTGWNKSCGTYESRLTQELYHFNYNSNGEHGIYLIDGNTGVWKKIIIDSELGFTDDQESVATTRVSLRYVKDKDGNIVEKHLMWTMGNKWQGWINVIAAIGSDGFNSTIYPYWELLQPHFDRRELLEWPVRPPMIKPTITPIPVDSSDSGRINRIADKNIRVAFLFEYTDGRFSTFSPYSLPLQVKTEEYLNNPDNLPKRASIKMYAGSCMVEKIKIFIQEAADKSLDSTAVYNDWRLYDTIQKFDLDSSGSYWLRQNPWASYNYDPVFNTIEYEFDNSKLGSLYSQEDAQRLQTGMPQISKAMTDMDDAVILCNNRYGYKNLSKSIIDQISASILEKQVESCSIPLRTVYLYAYIGQCNPDFYYTSQVAYTYGSDTQVRFGGLRSPDDNSATIDLNESKYFKLDFADRKSLRVYLKGTPYYADGEWCIVKSDNTIEPINKIYDFSNADTLTEVQNIYRDGSYFICRFKLVVPAGRYIATLGRHNVESSSDWRGTSTYIYGLANSRVKSTAIINGNGDVLVTLRTNSITSYSKEMEIDCTSQNVDFWGNGQDVFFVYCPYINTERRRSVYRFIEGYFKESRSSNIPVELFPYQASQHFDDWGKLTDKNGFYWGYTKATASEVTDVQMFGKVSCVVKSFNIPTSQTGGGWKVNADAYLETQNNGSVGDCNRVIFKGTVKSIDGTIGYSNIAISVKGGSSTLTKEDGSFELIIHNGQAGYLTRNIYVNAGGNFIVTLQDCGVLQPTYMDESIVPCTDCNPRIYPEYNIRVQIKSNSIVSLKDNGKYSIGAVVADLAGRMTFVNKIIEVEGESFLKRNNTNPTYIQMLLGGALNFITENPDFKWFSPYVSKNINNKKYVQWVGDKIIYLDNNGNVTNDAASATFIKIVIDSLFNANVTSNFTLLAGYQFVKGDRVRIIDDGDGNIFDIAIYGNPIDSQIYGTNYNQAAINAGLLQPSTNTVLNSASTTTSTEVGIIVKYDPRYDKLLNKTGFWIDIYTPNQQTETIPFFEVPGFYPIIDGVISEFTGFVNGNPNYNRINSIDIDFWDTYYLSRNIAGKYFSHSFESANVTDMWGANITSGGRIQIEDKDAKQYWLGGGVSKSDGFTYYNGLAMFREQNKKDYGIYPFGEILAAHTKRNLVAFNCENDWFVAEYNMPYTKVSSGGQLIVTNLDQNLSLPMRKGGGMYGICKEDLETIVIDEDYFFWFDRKNTAFIKCTYQDALDISQQTDTDRQITIERGGLQSYLNMKVYTINIWNMVRQKEKRFDVVAGIDGERGNIYLTFRPRRNNSNDPRSYVNTKRSWDINNQETFVYSIQYRGWLPCVNFTPEAYGRLRGNWANSEMLTFAAGAPYYHNNTDNDSYNNFYGVQTEPIVVVVLNKDKDAVKIMGSLAHDINGSSLFADLIYDTQVDSFSYIASNSMVEREKMLYAKFNRNMVSYPPISPDELYRSMLTDGKRVFGSYVVVRMVQKYADLGKYFQLTAIDYLYANSHPTKP